MSKAQKKAWTKRKALKAVFDKPKAFEEEPIEYVNFPVGSPPDERQVLRQWIDAAPTHEERAKRKAAMLGIMYSGSADSLAATIDKMATDNASANVKPFNPDQYLHINKPGDWCVTDELVKDSLTNPKTLMGAQKVPVLSVVPPASILAQATAMRYGAFIAKKADGSRGYGPYNWRDQPIEAHIYIDAAMRHLMQWWDGDEVEIIRDDEGRVIDEISHLAFAIATLGVLIDAVVNHTAIDDRPKVRRMAASEILATHKLPRYEK